MAHHQPSLRVFVDARFTGDGFWAIHVKLELPDRPSLPLVSDFLRPGRRWLEERIVREALYGRALGARWIQVYLDTGYKRANFALRCRNGPVDRR